MKDYAPTKPGGRGKASPGPDACTGLQGKPPARGRGRGRPRASLRFATYLRVNACGRHNSCTGPPWFSREARGRRQGRSARRGAPRPGGGAAAVGPLPSGGGRGGEGAGAEGEGKGPLAGAPPLGVSSGCPGDGRPAPVPRLASPCRPRLFTCPRAAPPGPARRRRAAAREGAGAANSNGGGRRAAVTSAPRARGARRERAAGRGRGGGGRRAERSGGFCACAGGRRAEGAERPFPPPRPRLLPSPGPRQAVHRLPCPQARPCRLSRGPRL